MLTAAIPSTLGVSLGGSKPPAFFLAGDSTTAPQSQTGGGWGDGFLNRTLKNGAYGINFGVDGATTVSFVEHGHWAKVIAAVKKHRDAYEPIVTIQFGHNDQKPAAGICTARFVANLMRLMAEAAEAGATPILLTSLTRRNFDMSNSPPRIVKDLLDVTTGTKTAADAGNCHLLDLNQASMSYCNDIGPEAAHKYNLEAIGDTTHLNHEGSVVFGSMVADLLRWVFPKLRTYVAPDTDIILATRQGTYLWPSVTMEELAGIQRLRTS
ncbi:esterase [Xylariales sp. PMI_506]|nr:esterase [Xylariales sp. PMI_506]